MDERSEGWFHSVRERKLFQVLLDSTFALAHVRLANVAMNSGDVSLAIRSLRMASEHRDSAPARDQLFLDAMLAQAMNQDTRQSRRILDSLVTLYPDDKEARSALALLYPQDSDERVRLLERPCASIRWTRARSTVSPTFAPAAATSRPGTA